MREINVGIRIREDGLSFFGIEQVNSVINLGGKVVSIDGGGAVLREMAKNGDDVALTLSGCDIKVIVDDAGTENSPAMLEHDEVYRKGAELIRPFMRVEGGDPESANGEDARNEIETGVESLRRALEINPANWSAYWVIGKGYQALQETELAYEAFKKSYQLPSNNVDVAREYMLECLKLGNADEAIVAAKHAVELEPDDAGLLANLALALLIGSKNDEAMEAIEKSLLINPDDSISLNVKVAIVEIQNGVRDQPKTYFDL